MACITRAMHWVQVGCIVNKMVYCQASSIPNPAKKNELFKKWAAVLMVEFFFEEHIQILLQ